LHLWGIVVNILNPTNAIGRVLNQRIPNINNRKPFLVLCWLIALSWAQLMAESRSISLLFFHFEPRAYNLNRQELPDSIEAYIRKYGRYLVDPNSLKKRMLGHSDFAADQLAQKRIFELLDRFKGRITGLEEFKDTDLEIKVHFILWDEALETLQREAKNPSFNIVQIAPEFLGGIAGHGNVVSLDPFIRDSDADRDYARVCLQSCRIANKGPLLALPFWVSMRTLFVRKDMLEAVPEIDPAEAFSSWEAFERTGRIFGAKMDSLRRTGFPRLRSFWAINIHDKDMNTLQNLTPVIYSHGGMILKDKWWWKEAAFNRPKAMEGIRTYFDAAKSVGALEDTTFGRLLDHFHAGRYAVVLCGTWDLAYWRGTKPDSSSLIEIRLPPANSPNPATLLEGCNLVILKRPGAGDVRLEVELLKYLSTDPIIQTEYIPSGARLSVLKTAQARDSISRPEYYAWLNQPGLVRPFPNSREMAVIFNALTHKYRLASILQNIKNAPALSENVWEVAEDAINATADNLNRQIIPSAIYYAFYTKINILVILLLLCAVAFAALRLTKRMKRLSEEKDRIESDLMMKLRVIQNEKQELEHRQKEAIEELYQNQGKIKMLTTRLSLLSDGQADPNAQAHLQTIEQVSTQILSLTSKSKTLQAELDRTSEKILTNEQVVSKLENELGNLKNPEITIDFHRKSIRKKDGTEFVLSNAAKQYKMDFFRYLEFIVRHRLNRMHLLVFGYLDMEIFSKSLLNRTVREYNYKGKFGKVKSGINRTFKNNIGKDLIIHDDLKVYVYFADPETIYQIGSKEKEIDLQFIPLTSRDRPQVIALSAYENLDYYAFDTSIRVWSNIQESISRFEEALALPDGEEKGNALEEALRLDPRNYTCLFALLQAKPFDFFEEAGQAERDLLECVRDLETLLGLDLEYEKKITNLPRIKEEYKEVYSWSYVDQKKSDEIEKVGLSAFRAIIGHERKFLESLLAVFRERKNRLHLFQLNVVHLQNTARLFRNYLDAERLRERIIGFAGTIDLFSEPTPAAHAHPLLPGFIAFLYGQAGINIETAPGAGEVQTILDFVEWLSGRKAGHVREMSRALSDYRGDKRLTKDAVNILEKFAFTLLK
jgi:maltose-binding protein MalE